MLYINKNDNRTTTTPPLRTITNYPHKDNYPQTISSHGQLPWWRETYNLSITIILGIVILFKKYN